MFARVTQYQYSKIDKRSSDHEMQVYALVAVFEQSSNESQGKFGSIKIYRMFRRQHDSPQKSLFYEDFKGELFGDEEENAVHRTKGLNSANTFVRYGPTDRVCTWWSLKTKTLTSHRTKACYDTHFTRARSLFSCTATCF